MISVDDVYTDIELLIELLRLNGVEGLAKQLDYMMHHVAWTSSTELLEEIDDALGKCLEDCKCSKDLMDRIQNIRGKILLNLR